MKENDYQNKDSIKNELSVREMFTFLWTFTKGTRLYFALFSGSVFLGGFLGAFAASRFGSLIEKLTIQSATITSFEIYSLAILEVISITFIFIGRRGLSTNALKAIAQLRSFLFLHMKKLHMSYYDREPAGRIVTRLTHDVDTLETFYSGTLARLISVFLTASTVIIVMIQHTWWLGIIALLLTFPSIILIWSFRKKAHEVYRNYSKSSSAVTARLAEFLNGMSVIRSFGLEDWSREHFESRVKTFMHSADRVNLFNSLMRPATLFLTHLPTLFLFSVGSFMVSKGTLALGALIAFLRLADRLARPAGTLMMEVHLIQSAVSSTERLTSFLEEDTENLEIPNQRTENTSLNKMKGHLQFLHINMKYSENSPWVLQDFTFEIKAGQKIGIMGRTGSGKSTIISLLTGLYPFQEGSLLIDSLPHNEWKLDQLRTQIGFVSQATYLMPGTIRENLSLGENFSDAHIWNACEESGLASHLKANQRTLDTEVHSQGSNFSQGEAQLFALTRVLLQNPSIFILDEATANLDYELEELVQKAIEKVSAGRTCIFIAHRLSTLTRCEKVIILQNGKIIKNISGTDLTKPSPEILSHLEASP